MISMYIKEILILVVVYAIYDASKYGIASTSFFVSLITTFVISAFVVCVAWGIETLLKKSKKNK